MIIDLDVGRGSSNPSLLYAAPIDSTGGLAGLVFFSANAQVGASGKGREPYASDGTPEGTRLLCDVCPGRGSSNPRWFTAFNGLLFFHADDCTHGIELFRYSQTTTSCTLVADIARGAASSFPSMLTVFSPTRGVGGALPPALFFTVASPSPFGGSLSSAADRSISGWQLWRSDGTKEGTVSVVDGFVTAAHFDLPEESLNLSPYTSHPPQRLIPFRDNLFFTARRGRSIDISSVLDTDITDSNAEESGRNAEGAQMKSRGVRDVSFAVYDSDCTASSSSSSSLSSCGGMVNVKIYSENGKGTLFIDIAGAAAYAQRVGIGGPPPSFEPSLIAKSGKLASAFLLEHPNEPELQLEIDLASCTKDDVRNCALYWNQSLPSNGSDSSSSTNSSTRKVGWSGKKCCNMGLFGSTKSSEMPRWASSPASAFANGAQAAQDGLGSIISFNATLGYANLLLRRVSYRGRAFENGLDRIIVSVSDISVEENNSKGNVQASVVNSRVSTSSSVTVTIRQVNDPPQVTITLLSSVTGLPVKVLSTFDSQNSSKLEPGEEEAEEEKEVVDEGMHLQWDGVDPSPAFLRVVISDPDARESVTTGLHGEPIFSPLNITLSFSLLSADVATQPLGQTISLGLANRHGITFLDGSAPTGSEKLSFLADIDSANAALSSLEVKRHAASGKRALRGVLTVLVDDRGLTGAGGAKSARFEVKIDLKAFNANQ